VGSCEYFGGGDELNKYQRCGWFGDHHTQYRVQEDKGYP